MTITPPNSSTNQVPIRIHPQQPGTLRSDTGIQTVSNSLPNPVINTHHENNQAHQTANTTNSQISSQSIQHRVNPPTPIFHMPQYPPTFNTRLNTYDGVPIPPVLRPYQPPESKELTEEKDIIPNKIIICRIYACRHNRKQTHNGENEYLCSFTDSPNIRFARWVLQSQIPSDPNSLQKIREFNESNLESEFLKITSPINIICNNSLSPVEIICQYKENYLFRFKLNKIDIFCWEQEPNGEFYENLINDFQDRKKIQRKAPVITNGVKLILDSIQKQMGLIFCGEKNDIIEFLSVFTGKVILITNELGFSWWCNHFEDKSLSYVAYRGDDFTRAIIRQFQITNRTVLFLLTYNSVVSDFSYFKDYEFDCLIADDGERLKNPQGKKRSALQSINCKYRIVLTSKLKEDQLRSIQTFVNNDELIYFNEPKRITKYIFIRPTDYQLALLASKPFEASKICQNGFLVHNPQNGNKFDQSINVFEKYSAKFLFIGKVAKNINAKTVFIFKSHKLLDLCQKYLDSIKISCKTPQNKEAEALIALFFFNDSDINEYEIKIAVDCNCKIDNYYRLILYGTREHYFLSKKVQNRNIQKAEISHVPSPPLILFENSPELTNLEDIIKSSASLVSSSVFDFQSLGVSEFLDKNQIKNTIHELCRNGFQFDKRPLFQSVAIALFRALKPGNITLYPLSFFKLAKETQLTNISTFLCDSKKKWLEPIKTLFQTVDFTPIHELKKYFYKSADRILKSIEYKIITLNFFKSNDTIFKFEMLPPSHLYTLENDKSLVMSMKQGIFPPNDQKRIENIIAIMKSELIANDFQERYIFPFWSEGEIQYLANEFADFGGVIPYHRISLLSKTNEAIQSLKAELSRQLLNGYNTIKISSIVPATQKVTFPSIPQVITISEPLSLQLELRLQLGKSLRTALDYDINGNEKYVGKDLFLNLFVQLFGSQNPNLKVDAWFQLLKGIVEFGVSNLDELILSPSLPFRRYLTSNEIAFLEGKYAILNSLEEEKSEIPSCLKSEASLLHSIQFAIKEAKTKETNISKNVIEVNNEQQLSQIQFKQQRPLPTMPIGVQPVNTSTTPISSSQQQPQPQQSQPPSGGRNYSPPNELLQRAADLQNQKRHEKKKMKQMKPIIPVIPAKKQIQQIQLNQGPYIPPHQLPMPIPQPQLQEQQQPQPQVLMMVKTIDDKISNEDAQKQQMQQQQQWPRQQYYMPSVEIARKVTESNQKSLPPQEAIVLPPKKRPITVISNSLIHPSQQPQLQQQQPQPESMPIINPVISTQSTGIVEPLKTAHARMSQAAARQMINEDFLKSLPHPTRQSQPHTNNNVPQQQPPSPRSQQSTAFPTPQFFGQQQPMPSISQGSELQTDVSLLPLKKKHLANSPQK